MLFIDHRPSKYQEISTIQLAVFNAFNDSKLFLYPSDSPNRLVKFDDFKSLPNSAPLENVSTFDRIIFFEQEVSCEKFLASNQLFKLLTIFNNPNFPLKKIHLLDGGFQSWLKALPHLTTDFTGFTNKN